MRLLIDSVTVGSPGVIQLRDELTNSLKENVPAGADIVLLLPRGNRNMYGSSKLRVVNVAKPTIGWVGRWHWYRIALPNIAREYKADVVYSLSGILSKKLCNSLGTVTTVNNMIPFTPEVLRMYPLFFKARLRYELLRRAYVSSLRMADSVVLHSRHGLEMLKPFVEDITSKTFIALTGVPRDLVFNHSDPHPHPYNGVPYFLYFSAIYPYKNHLSFLRAYQYALDLDNKIPDLLLAGKPEDRGHLKKVLAAIREPGLKGKVKYIGTLDRKDIPAWLYYANVNFFPSMCETNPVTLAEILGLSGVLACSNIPPMSEVAGYAAQFFDPYSVDSMADVFVNLHRDRKRRDEMRHLALKRSDELSWNACGKAIWQAAMKAESGFHNRRRN